MHIKQTIARAGAHAVVTLTEEPGGRVLARRVWENAAQYITSTSDGRVTLVVPISSELDIKPKTWESA